MNIWQHWDNQKDALRAVLTEQMPAANAVPHIRHALTQVEQNALSEMDDDLLRQQAGILLSSLKNSLCLLEAHGTAKVWVSQTYANARPTLKPLWKAEAVLLAALAVWCGLRDEWLAMAVAVAALVTGICAFIAERKTAASFLPADEVSATVTIDLDRLFGYLDREMRSLDRYLNDFSYLNMQANQTADAADPLTVSRAADLMEALYDCDENERLPAEEAACRLLGKLGLQAVEYSDEHSRLFNTLPSKNVTRTLSPALLSAKDQQLLRRGTAAVRMDTAH